MHTSVNRDGVVCAVGSPERQGQLLGGLGVSGDRSCADRTAAATEIAAGLPTHTP
jgi:uncharacterized protein GlcG (DUF336 family)